MTHPLSGYSHLVDTGMEQVYAGIPILCPLNVNCCIVGTVPLLVWLNNFAQLLSITVKY